MASMRKMFSIMEVEFPELVERLEGMEQKVEEIEERLVGGEPIPPNPETTTEAETEAYTAALRDQAAAITPPDERAHIE
ncbi:hypothetical protein IH980_05855 [Patescibacteria group bacterium]|nr:hypothetical protein [Patescibacteria group bacterium]